MTSAEVSARPVVMLLVDDSPTDVLIIREALTQVRVQNTIKVVEDGVEAMDYLRQRGRHAGEPRPDLIIMDLNMPRKNGCEVLAEIKADPKLRHIPVVVLTTSQAEEDIARAYALHANCYVVKPMHFAGFTQVARSIHEFWCQVVTLPPEG